MVCSSISNVCSNHELRINIVNDDRIDYLKELHRKNFINISGEQYRTTMVILFKLQTGSTQVTEEKMSLSPFQKEKLEYYFNFFGQ